MVTAARAGRDHAVAPVDTLPGLGPSGRRALGEHAIATVADLAWVPPVAWDDLRAPVPLAAALAEARKRVEAGEVGRPPRFVIAAVVKSGGMIPIGRRRAVRVVLADPDDDKCTLHAYWFFTAHGVLALAKPGAKVLCVARPKIEPKTSKGERAKPPRCAHPDLLADTEETRVVRPRYPRLGPSEAAVRKAIAHSVSAGLALDPVPDAIVARERMPAAGPLLAAMHGVTREVPTGETQRSFLERLAWCEAFTRTWERLAAEERGDEARDAVPLPAVPALVAGLERELGFTFTGAQRAAIREISADLAATRPMRRLLLGDVGSGKTAVALAAAAQCVAAGKQAVILAPTSVLAEQYVAAVQPLVRATGIAVAFVAAGAPAAARRRDEAALRDGTAKLAIGTHALLEEGVTLPHLALVVVDEQQRLGVGQRLALVEKGVRPHLLTLSATPIPRTLALALRGELSTTTLDERPTGRIPVTTRLVPRSKLEEAVLYARDACERGERVFWVVPRIQAEGDEDPDVEIASAVARAEHLGRTLAPRRVLLLHGAMKADEKRDVMRAFRGLSGEADVLVATTVVEVGVDVPEATLMVIEGAERFGLAQLHQLRGRVGRSTRPSTCLLVHDDDVAGPARARLDALVAHDDGASIAKADLALRGAGDLGGTRQHGAEEEMLYLDASASYPWLDRLEEDARTLRATDPSLAGHPVLASFVRRFERVLSVRDEAG